MRLLRRARRLPQRLLYSEDRARRYGPAAWAMSALRRRRLLLTHAHANVRIAPTAYVGPGTSLHIPAGGRLTIGPGVELRHGFRAEIEGDGRIEIGAGSILTYDVLMQCTTSILVGERCMFGQATIVVDGQHRFRDVTRPMLEQGYDWHPIEVGDDAVITSKCTIMASVGERAFIGAHSLVNRDVPPYAVAVGSPARVVERFGPAASPV